MRVLLIGGPYNGELRDEPYLYQDLMIAFSVEYPGDYYVVSALKSQFYSGFVAFHRDYSLKDLVGQHVQ